MSVAPRPARSQDHGIVPLAELVNGLGVTARVLVIAAHPDDEDSRLIAFLARGRAVETAYLSLTRGDGGQNLIGPELGEALGVIRTEELLAARRVDGAHQFFTRAYDYGYSKSAEEAFEHWPREELLRDAVTVVRAFRPHVIVSVFSGTPSDGHGQHQAAGIIAREAYEAAIDTVRFPRAATAGHGGWRPLKFYRSANFRGTPTIRYNVGEYAYLLGRSYAEIASDSRSQHKSQAFGVVQRRGVSFGALMREATRVDAPAVAAEERSLFDGIDTTWARLRSQLRAPAARVALDSVIGSIAEVRRSLDLQRSWQSAGGLARVIRHIDAVLAAETRPAEDVARSARDGRARAQRALLEAAGVAIEAAADREMLAQSESAIADSAKVVVSVFNRGRAPIRLQRAAVGLVPEDRGWSAPRDAIVLPDSALQAEGWLRSSGRSGVYWRARPRDGDMYATAIDGVPEDARPIGPEASVDMMVDGVPVTVRLPIVRRFADPVMGDVQRPLAVAPAISVTLDHATEYAPANVSFRRVLSVRLRSATDSGPVRVSVRLPRGLSADSASRTVMVPANAVRTVEFIISGRVPAGRHRVSVVAERSGVSFGDGWTLIDYPHIRPRRMYEPAALDLEAIDLKVPATLTVGYITGAGDNSGPMLQQLGLRVTTIDPARIPSTDLRRFDAIVVGSRAYESSAELVQHNARLLEYVRMGGTLVVQYGQYEMARPGMMPYPITLGRPAARVSVEDAPVRILDPAARVLTFPNRITTSDFAGWVQDRSLYMPATFDDRYTPLLEMNDPGETPNRGGLLVARYGRGTYIYTTLAFFRQLPAGVPGAARLFVNLLAAGEGTGTTASEVP